MDLASLIGLLLSLSTVVVGIALGGNFAIFVDIPSIFITVGGTIGVTIIKFKLTSIGKSFKMAIQAVFFDRSESPRELIEVATEIAKIVQKDGILALEKYQVKNRFFAKGIGLVVDGHDQEFIQKILDNEMSKYFTEGELSISLLSGMGEAAPAFGMIGTLIGLVQMLQSMNDPSSIGPAMAVALLTTLYGSLIANIFTLPLADKLGKKLAEEKNLYHIIMESVASITQGFSPRVLAEMLESLIPSESPKVKKGDK